MELTLSQRMYLAIGESIHDDVPFITMPELRAQEFAKEIETLEQRAEAAEQSAKVLGVVKPCPNCDGSGKNAQGDCCRIPGHARDCECTLCQWKNALYRSEHKESELEQRVERLERALTSCALKVESHREHGEFLHGGRYDCVEELVMEVREIMVKALAPSSAPAAEPSAPEKPKAACFYCDEGVLPLIDGQHVDPLNRVFHCPRAATEKSAGPEKPVCKRCGGSEEVVRANLPGFNHQMIPCPDCTGEPASHVDRQELPPLARGE